jgi:hypothetical protein
VTQRVPVRFLIVGRRDDSEHFSLLFADELVERDRLLPVLGERRIDRAGCCSPGRFGHDMVDMVGPGYPGVSIGSSGPDSQAFSPACLADRCAPFTGILSGHAPGHDRSVASQDIDIRDQSRRVRLHVISVRRLM